MFGWGEKKKIEEEKVFKKRTTAIEFFAKKLNVGKTYVEITSDEGDKFTISIYGHYWQHTHEGRDEDKNGCLVEPMVQPHIVNDSLHQAREYIRCICNQPSTFVDDPFKTKRTAVLTPRFAKIKKTVRFVQNASIGKIVPVEEEKK